MFDSKLWTQLNSERRLNHAKQLVAVFQVLCSLYGLTCLDYSQTSLELVSRSPLIHVVGRSICLYTDSEICSNWSLQRQMPFLVEGWMLKRRRNARCTTFADSVLFRSRTHVLCSIESFCSQLTLLHGSALGERSSGDTWKTGSSLSNFKYIIKIQYIVQDI